MKDQLAGALPNKEHFLRLLHFLILGGPEKILPKTINSFVVNSIFCEPPCMGILFIDAIKGLWVLWIISTIIKLYNLLIDFFIYL